MKTELIMNSLKANFLKRISIKTAWGRNEIEKEFEKAVNDTLLELLNYVLTNSLKNGSH